MFKKSVIILLMCISSICFADSDTDIRSYCRDEISIEDFKLHSYNVKKNTCVLEFAMRNDGIRNIYIGDMILWFHNKKTGEITKWIRVPLNKNMFVDITEYLLFLERADYFPMAKDMSQWEYKYLFDYRTCYFLRM